MAMRVRPTAPIGSLLKENQPKKKGKLDLGRHPRAEDKEHLDAIRQCMCAVCHREPVEAAHLRMGASGKPNPGIGAKPDDRYCLPLCTEHHREQHKGNELKFWREHGIDPIALAERLFAVSVDVDKMRAEVMRAK